MKNRSEIRMPAGAGNILPLRLFFSGMATRAGLDVDDIEDVKAAVSEACVLLMAGAGGGELRITVESGDGLWAECAVEGYEEETFDADAAGMSRIILEALADEADFFDRDGKTERLSFKFRTRV
ncbi:MAG: hypothetical protein DBX46_00570 [Clostridiales bacterium]|nr:MAG: hypothetical protein DBX46_00570 [Clostridiales bacterium]